MINKLSIIPISISVIIMIAIFILSAQPGEVSSELGYGAAQIVADVIFVDLEDMPPAQQRTLVDALSPFVFNAGHFVAYALLGFFVFLSSHLLVSRVWVQILSAMSVCAVYAVTDEIHQLFVPGRYASVIDFLIDVAGAACGVLVALFIIAFIYWVRVTGIRRNQKNIDKICKMC